MKQPCLSMRDCPAHLNCCTICSMTCSPLGSHRCLHPRSTISVQLLTHLTQYEHGSFSMLLCSLNTAAIMLPNMLRLVTLPNGARTSSGNHESQSAHCIPFGSPYMYVTQSCGALIGPKGTLYCTAQCCDWLHELRCREMNPQCLNGMDTIGSTKAGQPQMALTAT